MFEKGFSICFKVLYLRYLCFSVTSFCYFRYNGKMINDEELHFSATSFGPIQRDDIIKKYFCLGYQYNVILHLLSTKHGINVSERQLHRILRKFHLYRKRNKSDSSNVISFIDNELADSGTCIGYRQMHQRCLRNKINVTRETVRVTLKALDPDGVELRKSKKLKRRLYYSRGPNWVWHLDGYDKLKPYGFSIHAAIDGYSRRVLWLSVMNSNKNPRNICALYISFIQKLQGIPRKIIGDKGTENVNVALVQRFMRRNHNDNCAGYDSFKYMKSTSNQRIEAFWSQLRRSCTNFWINFFRDLLDSGHYDNSDPIHKDCVLFVFGDLVERNLLLFRDTWNSHRIRPSAVTDRIVRPAGVPNILYFAPEMSNINALNYKLPLCNADVTVTEVYASEYVSGENLCSKEFHELASILMSENSWDKPKNSNEGLNLFLNLLNHISNI